MRHVLLRQDSSVHSPNTGETIVQTNTQSCHQSVSDHTNKRACHTGNQQHTVIKHILVTVLVSVDPFCWESFG